MNSARNPLVLRLYASAYMPAHRAKISALHTGRWISAKKAPANLRYYDSGSEAQIYQRVYSARNALVYQRPIHAIIPASGMRNYTSARYVQVYQRPIRAGKLAPEMHRYTSARYALSRRHSYGADKIGVMTHKWHRI